MAAVVVVVGGVVNGCGSGTSSDSPKDGGAGGTAGSVGTGGGGGVGGGGTAASGGAGGGAGSGALGGAAGTNDGGGAGGMGGIGGCQQAPVAIVSGLTNAYGIAVDDANVFWTGYDSGRVMKAPKTGGTPQVLASGEPYPQFIALDAAHVYWTDGYSPGGRVGRVAKDGGPVETVVSVEGPRALALDTSTIYFTVYGLGSPVMSAPLAGGQATILADAQPNGRGIAVYQGIVYWGNLGAPGEDGSIMQLPVAGGTPSLVAANQGGPGAVAVDASGVYWGNFKQPAQGLTMIPLTGGTALNLAPDPVGFGLAIDDTRAYFANESGEIKSVPKTGGATCTIASGQPYPYMLALDAEFVYWTNYNLGTSSSIWKASKDCCENPDGGADASVDAATDGSGADADVDDAGGSG